MTASQLVNIISICVGELLVREGKLHSFDPEIYFAFEDTPEERYNTLDRAIGLETSITIIGKRCERGVV